MDPVKVSLLRDIIFVLLVSAGLCCAGSARPPYTFAKASTVQRSLQSHLHRCEHNTEDSSSCSIGIEPDATGCLRQWEGPSRPTGQLLPASSGAAPGQLDIDPPRSVCLIGCLELRVSYSTGRSISYAPGKNNFKKKKSKIPALYNASWNVCTMRTGLSDNLQETDDAC